MAERSLRQTFYQSYTQDMVAEYEKEFSDEE